MLGIESELFGDIVYVFLVHVASIELLICNTSSENKLPEEGMPNL